MIELEEEVVQLRKVAQDGDSARDELIRTYIQRCETAEEAAELNFARLTQVQLDQQASQISQAHITQVVYAQQVRLRHSMQASIQPPCQTGDLDISPVQYIPVYQPRNFQYAVQSQYARARYAEAVAMTQSMDTYLTQAQANASHIMSQLQDLAVDTRDLVHTSQVSPAPSVPSGRDSRWQCNHLRAQLANATAGAIAATHAKSQVQAQLATAHRQAAAAEASYQAALHVSAAEVAQRDTDLANAQRALETAAHTASAQQIIAAGERHLLQVQLQHVRRDVASSATAAAAASADRAAAVAATPSVLQVRFSASVAANHARQALAHAVIPTVAATVEQPAATSQPADQSSAQPRFSASVAANHARAALAAAAVPPVLQLARPGQLHSSQSEQLIDLNPTVTVPPSADERAGRAPPLAIPASALDSSASGGSAQSLRTESVASAQSELLGQTGSFDRLHAQATNVLAASGGSAPGVSTATTGKLHVHVLPLAVPSMPGGGDVPAVPIQVHPSAAQLELPGSMLGVAHVDSILAVDAQAAALQLVQSVRSHWASANPGPLSLLLLSAVRGAAPRSARGTKRRPGLFPHFLSAAQDADLHVVDMAVMAVTGHAVWDVLTPNGVPAPLELHTKQDRDGQATVIASKATRVAVPTLRAALDAYHRGVAAAGAVARKSPGGRPHVVLQLAIQSPHGSVSPVPVYAVELGADASPEPAVPPARAHDDQLAELAAATPVRAALGPVLDVLSAVAARTSHVPYRLSPITRLLQAALGPRGAAHFIPVLELHGEPDTRTSRTSSQLLEFLAAVRDAVNEPVELLPAVPQSPGPGVPRVLMDGAAVLPVTPPVPGGRTGGVDHVPAPYLPGSPMASPAEARFTPGTSPDQAQLAGPPFTSKLLLEHVNLAAVASALQALSFALQARDDGQPAATLTLSDTTTSDTQRPLHRSASSFPSPAGAVRREHRHRSEHHHHHHHHQQQQAHHHAPDKLMAHAAQVEAQVAELRQALAAAAGPTHATQASAVDKHTAAAARRRAAIARRTANATAHNRLHPKGGSTLAAPRWK